jgi:signal transduction histidine kinase
VIYQSVVEEVAQSLRPLAENKGLRFEVTVPAQDIIWPTNRRVLSQILLNLTGNAIKFTEQGEVRLELEQCQTNGQRVVEIRIMDTGLGLGSEEQVKLFQAFEQVSSRTARYTEGTGLGLYLSQKLANLLGGHITCQSEVGQGSTFTLAISAEK